MPYRDHKKAAIRLPFCVSPSSSLRRFAPGPGLRRGTCCIFGRFCSRSRSRFQQSDGFLPNPYAKPPFLHTNGRFSSSLYAESPILHTDRGKQGSRTEVRVGKCWFLRPGKALRTNCIYLQKCCLCATLLLYLPM